LPTEKLQTFALGSRLVSTTAPALSGQGWTNPPGLKGVLDFPSEARMQACRLFASAILCVISAFGHHNIAAYFDVTRTIRVSDTISKVEFLNPHVTISLDVKNAEGTVTHWKVETAGPNALMRGGITKVQFAEGTTLVVYGYPAKDGSPKSRRPHL
jgi:hypothetical protein